MVSRKNGDEITESHNAKQKIITAMLVTIQTKKENQVCGKLCEAKQVGDPT